MLLDFEKPANQSEQVKAKRLEYSQLYYNNFSRSYPYIVKVSTSLFNIGWISLAYTQKI